MQLIIMTTSNIAPTDIPVTESAVMCFAKAVTRVTKILASWSFAMTLETEVLLYVVSALIFQRVKRGVKSELNALHRLGLSSVNLSQ